MDQKVVQAVSKQIYQQFPQVAGTKPTIKSQPSGRNGEANFLLVFTNQDKSKTEVPVKTWVRVLVNDQGEILKLSTSR